MAFLELLKDKLYVVHLVQFRILLEKKTREKLLKKKMVWIKELEKRRGLRKQWKQTTKGLNMCKEPHQNTGNSACLYVLHVYSVTYYKATSCFVSRPDEPNPVLSLATWAGEMGYLADLGFVYLLLSGQHSKTMVLEIFLAIMCFWTSTVSKHTWKEHSQYPAILTLG